MDAVRRNSNDRIRTGGFGLVMLSSLLIACTAFGTPIAQPIPASTARPVVTRDSSPTTTTPVPSVMAQARFGTYKLESLQGSGVSGTFTAQDTGGGITLLKVQLAGAADFNPWGIYVLIGCSAVVPENQRPAVTLPDIEMGRKEETIETATYASLRGNLVVIIYGSDANGTPRAVACANLGLPVEGIAQATRTATQACAVPTTHSASTVLAGEWLAYSATQDNNGDIYVVRLDKPNQAANTATVIRLTNDPAADFDPTWSPDGERIAFRSQRDGNDEIYVMNANGDCQVNLTHDPANDWSPAWSPDGTRIAFARFFDGKPYTDVAVMNDDGTGLKRLTTAQGEYPAWSPDGKHIAFASARDGNYEIYVMNSDGSGQTRLTNNPAYDMAPVWSPDGTRIAYDTQRDHYPPAEVGIGPEFEIHSMNADGSGDRQLTSNSQEDRFPAWAPNARIAFTHNGALFVMDPDGSHQFQALASGSFPAWRPSVRSTP